MLGIIDRLKKERVWCAMHDRLKDKLLLFVKNNVFTPVIVNDDGDFVTTIYSDWFASYRTDDFTYMGFVLCQVNHSGWFSHGILHINSKEGLWSCIKRV